MEKKFKTVDEQLKILRERDLNIDLCEASKILKTTNYYNLINGYSYPFLLATNTCDSCTKKIDENAKEMYLKGSKFSEIYSLYTFDKSISNLFFKYILIIENRVKSLVAYYFSEKHGHKNEEYLDINNFNDNIKYSNKLKSDFDFIINKRIKETLSANSMQPYLKHYSDTHGYVPLWVLVNSLTFGDISTFFKVLEEDLQVKISNDFSKNQPIDPGIFNDYLSTLATYRNILAHDERFYKYKKVNKNMRNIKVNFKGFLGLKHVHSSVFAVMVIFRSLLKDDEFQEFIDQFMLHINKINSNLSTIDLNFILKEMNIISFVTLRKTPVKISESKDIISFFK